VTVALPGGTSVMVKRPSASVWSPHANRELLERLAAGRTMQGFAGSDIAARSQRGQALAAQLATMLADAWRSALVTYGGHPLPLALSATESATMRPSGCIAPTSRERGQRPPRQPNRRPTTKG
jgi:hypothetical protein